MDFQIKQQQGKSVIKLPKNKSFSVEAAGFQNTILDLIDKNNKIVVVDLSNIDFITSYGIGMLVYAHTTCSKRNIAFHLVGVNDKILESLITVHLDKILDIQDKV
jgi:anti-anti-sigma factor